MKKRVIAVGARVALGSLAVLVVLGWVFGSSVFPKTMWMGRPPSTPEIMHEIVMGCRVYESERGGLPRSRISPDDALVKAFGPDEGIGLPKLLRLLRSKSDEGVDYWYLNEACVDQTDAVVLVEKESSHDDGVFVCALSGEVKLARVPPGGNFRSLLGKRLSELDE